MAGATSLAFWVGFVNTAMLLLVYALLIFGFTTSAARRPALA